MADTTSSSRDSWWHERPTKAADLDNRYRSTFGYGRRSARLPAVWKEGALVVAIVFALALSIIPLVGAQ